MENAFLVLGPQLVPLVSIVRQHLEERGFKVKREAMLPLPAEEARDWLKVSLEATESRPSARSSASARAEGKAKGGKKGKEQPSPRDRSEGAVSVPDELVAEWSNGSDVLLWLLTLPEETGEDAGPSPISSLMELMGPWSGPLESPPPTEIHTSSGSVPAIAPPPLRGLLGAAVWDEYEGGVRVFGQGGAVSRHGIRALCVWSQSESHAGKAWPWHRRWILRTVAEAEHRRQSASRMQFREETVSESALLSFLFPPEQQHPRSTGRLLAVGLYGPLGPDGSLRGGLRRSRPLTVPELRGIMDEVETEDILRAFAGSMGLSHATRRAILQDVRDKAAPLPSVARHQVKQMLRPLPRTADGQLYFRDIQTLARQVRAQRRKELQTMYPSLVVRDRSRQGGSSHGKDAEPAERDTHGDRRRTWRGSLTQAVAKSLKPPPPLLRRGTLRVKSRANRGTAMGRTGTSGKVSFGTAMGPGAASWANHDTGPRTPYFRTRVSSPSASASMRMTGTSVIAGEASGVEEGGAGWTGRGVDDGGGGRDGDDEEEEEDAVEDEALATVTAVLDGRDRGRRAAAARRKATRSGAPPRRPVLTHRPGTRGTLDVTQKLSNNGRYRLVERLATRNTHRITSLEHADDPAICVNARILREDPSMDDDGWDRCCVYHPDVLGKPKSYHGNPMQSLLG